MSQELIVLYKIVPAKLFDNATEVDKILDRIEKEARAESFDISTNAGREACKSLAYKVARSKTALDEMGKELVAGWKRQATAVDNERRRIRERLDTLRDEVRAPVTKWEQDEEARKLAHEKGLQQISNAFPPLPNSNDKINGIPADEEPYIAALKQVDEQLNHFDARDWEEYKDRADSLIAELRDRTAKAIEATHDRIAHRAEMRRLQEENRKHEEAAAKLKAEKEEADRRVKEAEEKATREAQRAREAQEKAARDKKEAEENAARVIREAAEKAARERQEAENKAKRAVEEERQRIEREKQQAAEQERRREADKRHREKIHNEIIDGLLTCGIAHHVAIEILQGLQDNRIPHITINY